jgi:hypothetical protein
VAEVDDETEYELIRPLGDNLYELHPKGWWGDITRVLIQVARRDGRTHVTGMLAVGGGVGSRTLRAIPLAQVESMLNHPEFVDPGGESEEQPLSDLVAPLLERTEVGASSRRFIPRERPQLGRPDGSDPEAFYRLVAQAYNDAVLTTTAPARELADEAGVPVTTVHRWVAEARRRGFLPPARQGRAG